MIKIAIDPQLKSSHAKAINWVFRLLLTSCGYSWCEVNASEQGVDLYYGSHETRVGQSKITIVADLKQWEELHNKKLTKAISFTTYLDSKSLEKLITKQSSAVTIHKDIIFDLFWLVSGFDEKNLEAKKHGHFELDNTIYLKEKLFTKAIGSDIGTFLKYWLDSLGYKCLSRWPYHKLAAATFSHDCDYPEVIRWLEPFRIIKRQGLKSTGSALDVGLGKRHHWHFNSWCELERQFDINSAFYFVARQGSLLEYASGLPDPFYDVTTPKFKYLFKQLLDQGMEIGLHASYLAHTSNEKFLKEKERLENAANTQVIGNRHHYWHLSETSPEDTLLQHNKIGFLYDSSLAHDKYIGWRRHCSWPYFPYHPGCGEEIGTLQIPSAWMDQQLFMHRKINGENTLEQITNLLNTVIKQGGVFMINFHDYLFDDQLYPGIVETYKTCCEIISNNSSLWVATPGQLADYWVTRDNTIRNQSFGLGV